MPLSELRKLENVAAVKKRHALFSRILPARNSRKANSTLTLHPKLPFS